MANQAPYSGLAQLMEMQGRGPDTRLVHMTPMELRTLQAMSPTGRLTTNPETGLPEAGVLEDILPILLPIAGAVAAPYLLPAIGITGLSGVAAGAIGSGVGTTLGGLVQGKGVGESLVEGGLSGLMSYGLGSALSPATAAASGVPTAAAPSSFPVAGPESAAKDVLAGAGMMAPSNITTATAASGTPSVSMTMTPPDFGSIATLGQSVNAAGIPAAGTPTSELGAFLGTSKAPAYNPATDVFAPVAPDAGMIGQAKYNVFTSTPDFLGSTAVGGSALGPTQLPTYGTAGTAGISGAMARPLGQELGLIDPDEMPFELEYDAYRNFDADLEGGRERGIARARRLQRPPAFSSPAELQRMATTGGFGTFLAADGGRVPMDLNINGEPHQLSYINQDEADLLRSLGGAGQNVMGIPAYFDAGEGTAGEGAPDDGSGVGAAADGSDSAPGASMGLGGYSDETAAAVQEAMDTMSDMDSVGMDPMGVVGNVNTFSMDPSQSNTMGLGTSQNLQAPILAPPPNMGFIGRAAFGLFGLQPKGFTVNPNMTYKENMGIGVPGITNAALSGAGFDTSLGTFSSPTMSPGGGDVDDGDSTEGAGDDPYYRPYGDPYNTGTAMAQGGVVQAGIGGLLKGMSPAYMFTQKPEMFSPAYMFAKKPERFSPAYMLAKKPEMLSPAYMMAKNPEMMSPAYMAAKGKSPIETVMKNMGMAQGGGISSLAYGGDPAPVGFANKAFEGMVPGTGTGMSDDVPFSIEGQQPALLSRDEYVLPADVVSQLGDGSSGAGADMLDSFVSNVRQTKYGNTQQPAPVGPQLMTGLMRQGGVV